MTRAAPDWAAFWDAKANADTDFQATGRGLMDVVGFLCTVHEIVGLLAPDPKSVLVDIGCGTGLVTLAIAPWVAHVHAIDLSENMVSRAKQNLSHVGNADVKVGSIIQMGLPDSSCDRLLAYSVLQYLSSESEVISAFKEIFRVLHTGGRALLAANPDPAKRTALEQVIKARPDQDAVTRELELQKILVWIDPDRLCGLAEQVGFRARACQINERIWQHFYMFDLVLEKL